ncbi:hypothetical protein N7453_011782 [Penicillium expansum]|nr:hypothetical protein N7453_011782 [Penicillium expansum]
MPQEVSPSHQDSLIFSGRPFCRPDLSATLRTLGIHQYMSHILGFNRKSMSYRSIYLPGDSTGFSTSSSFSSTPFSSTPFSSIPPPCPVPAFLDQLRGHFDTSELGKVHGGHRIVANLAPFFDTQCVCHCCSADAPGVSTSVSEYARGA